jgi:hypothetical protein
MQQKNRQQSFSSRSLIKMPEADDEGAYTATAAAA